MLMVNLRLGTENKAVLKVAGILAKQYEAAVIGIAAFHPLPLAFGDVRNRGNVLEVDSVELRRNLLAAENEFKSALRGNVGSLEWRSTGRRMDLSNFVTRQARTADLVITEAVTGGVQASSRVGDPGSLIMHAGRPVLVVPSALSSTTFERVLVAWKDTREARRAVADALPVMRRADAVTVVEIATNDNLTAARRHLDDVVIWLKRHGVLAKACALNSMGEDGAGVRDFAEKEKSDLIVAGAYSHSRLHDWVMGGVTRELLLNPTRCLLLSH
jgi:nucleotide-binding universal stress UspA family protein